MLLEINHVTKSFGGVGATNDVSVSVPEGKILRSRNFTQRALLSVIPILCRQRQPSCRTAWSGISHWVLYIIATTSMLC